MINILIKAKFSLQSSFFYNSILTSCWSAKNFSSRLRYFSTFISQPFTTSSSFFSKTNQENQTAFLSHIIEEFRRKGHFYALIDPLSTDRNTNEETTLLRCFIDRYKNDETPIDVTNLLIHYHQPKSCTFKKLINYLQSIYCSSIGIEFMHISKWNECEWITNRWEQICSNHNSSFDENNLKRLASILIKSEVFDQFLGAKFPTVKRYSGEGAEGMLIILDTLFQEACINHQTKDIIIGMPHRGRLNFLDILLKVSAVKQFQKMSGQAEIDLNLAPYAKGDVLSHLFSSIDLYYNQENHVHVSLLPNPSHLEAISPVVCGKARAKALRKKKRPYVDKLSDEPFDILPIQIHGDASFTGQGVVMETLSLANLESFKVNGSIHLVVNNGLGYTTPGKKMGRSSHYCSDIMKMIESPCIHVNGNQPQDVFKVVKLALEYRQKFEKDVLIDLNCFRRWGHNELDDPTYTNPLMYKIINSQTHSMPSSFASSIFSPEELETIKQEYKSYLTDQYKKKDSFKSKNNDLQKCWSSMTHPSNDHITVWNTGIPLDMARYVGEKSIEVKKEFNVHPNLEKVLIKSRKKKLLTGTNIDWSTSEAIAFGSLLYQGFNIRLSGQDVGRGTFGQRHAILFDQFNEQTCVPLNSLNKGYFEIANSILSEEAVLGFEYGFSIDSPNNLVIWEAQFGDFFNGAQIIVDTFISTGESKWLLQCGLVILLPHGYDGAGPEHSSCRIERFLQNSNSSETKYDSDSVNWSIVNPTTPAQYFHVLRRQMIRNYRKPLIIASPKLLLRHPLCVSNLDQFKEGTYFKTVLEDPEHFSDNQVEKVIFCSGKHYYTLYQARQKRVISNIALIRIEELCPFPIEKIYMQLLRYKNAKEFIWSQEEHRNMGPWNFVNVRFNNLLHLKLKYIGRDVSDTPASGIGVIHQQESKAIIDQIFKA